MPRDNSAVEIEYDAADLPAFTDTLVRMLSRCLYNPPRHLPPLYETIDTEAVFRLLESADDAVVMFEYEGWEVTVTESVIRCTQSTV